MKNFDLIIITNLPAFYKINLFNRVAQSLSVLVIFTHDSSTQRNEDFYHGTRNFHSVSISNMSGFKKSLFLTKLLFKNPNCRLLLGGWDYFLYWIAAFLSKKKHNELIIESSYIESKTSGLKGFTKRLFLKRITKAYASGTSQIKLLHNLNFKGEIIKTKGVGIFNIVPQPAFSTRNCVSDFIYVGRLSPEKNLKFLIQTFNTLPNLRLNIIGFGPEEYVLKSIAKSNVNFYGAIVNSELHKFYQQNDVFILPSLSETWGMVVEEALNNGLPIIVSDKVGCAEEIVNEKNGLIFKLSEPLSIFEAIQKITDIQFYNSLRQNISQIDFNKLAEEQVNCYLG
jgi:glycosyltransferase involved in cell wall biosynthesis